MITGIWVWRCYWFFFGTKTKTYMLLQSGLCFKKVILEKKKTTKPLNQPPTYTHIYRYKSLYLIMFLTLQSHNILSLIKT